MTRIIKPQNQKFVKAFLKFLQKIVAKGGVSPHTDSCSSERSDRF
jgi:hypothetical protein